MSDYVFWETWSLGSKNYDFHSSLNKSCTSTHTLHHRCDCDRKVCYYRYQYGKDFTITTYCDGKGP